MPKMFCICPHVAKVIDLDRSITPFVGAVTIGFSGNWGVYLISGTAAQLTAIANLSDVCLLCVVTQNSTRWTELDGNIPTAVRTRINTWLANNGFTGLTVPTGWTYSTLVKFISRRMRSDFELDQCDIEDS